MSSSDLVSLHTALDAYDGGHADTAEPVLVELSRRYPSSYPVQEALGSIYAEAGSYDRALPYLQRAQVLAPREALAHANLGATLLKLDRTADAVRELSAAARLDPANAGAQSSLGQALVLAGRPAEGAAAFAKASGLNPADAQVRYLWALALFQGGAFARADAVLQAIPEAAATDEVESLRADVAEHLHRYQEALVHFQAAAARNPSDANLYALTAELLRHWNWEQAITTAQFAERQYPESTHFHLAEGIALYANGTYPKAAAVFSHLLASAPENAMYADLLGRTCTLVVEGVVSECEGLLLFAQHHPENAQAATYAATALLHRPTGEAGKGEADRGEAERLLRQAMAADPKLADAHMQMGVLLQNRQQWQESAAELEKAVALRPEMSEAHYRLSRAYAHLGQREAAQREIALQQRYSQQEKDSLNARMGEVVTFVLHPS